MHLVFESMRLRAILFLAAALMGCGFAIAAELQLQTIATFDEDLIFAATRASGDVAVLRAGAIDRLEDGAAPAPVARATEGQRLFLASDGSHYGVSTHRAGAADFAPAERFELHAADGALLWSIGPTQDVSFVISNHGAVVGLQLNVNIAAQNQVHFYGDNGTLLAEMRVPRLLGGAFDPDGQIFVAVSGSHGAIGFDLSGKQIWTVPGGRLTAAAPAAGTVAIVGSGRLTIVKDGQVSESVELGDLLIRRVAVSADGGRVAIAAKQEIRLYDAMPLREVQKIESGSPSLAWTSIDFSPDGGKIAAGVARELGAAVPIERRHPDGEVRVYSIDGDLLFNGSIAFTHWNIFTPTVLWRPSGNALTITTRRAVYQTALQ